MKSKNTKRALLMSVLSMMLCMAMLVGSTFAWFTDSVTSGKNKIVAGNLDVELDYSLDGTNWTEVNENTNMFKDGALWEPGYTEVVYLRVRNAGSLALKYQFGINVADKVIGKTYADKDIDLANFIEFGVVEAGEAFTDRAAARNAVKDVATLISAGYSSAEGHLTAGNTSDMLALVVYMPETVGNDANHGADKTQPEIYMGINLVATQDTVESDSFGDDYDENAGYPGEISSLDDLAYTIKDGTAYITTGGNLSLNADVDVTDGTRGLGWYFVSENPVYLDLKGHKLIPTIVSDGTDITVTDSVGDGALKYVKAGTGTVTLDNCAVKYHLGGCGMYAYADGKLIINSGTYECSPSSQGGVIEINGGEFTGKGGSIQNMNGGTIIINDGNFGEGVGVLNYYNGTVIINGGTFAKTGNFITSVGKSFIINGGTFHVDVSTLENVTLGENAQCVDNGDGTWTVVGVDERNTGDPFAG